MNGNGVWASINNVLEWIMYAAYLNLLWILFTFVGLIIFGWMPATIAVYSTWRRILRDKDRHVPIFKTFLEEYKTSFIKKNVAGFLILFGGALIFLYFQFYQQTEGIINIIYTGFMFVVIFTFLNIVIYLPPVMVHFKLKFFQNFRQAILLGLSSLSTTFLIYIMIFLAGVIVYYYPSLILPFGFSALPLFIMKVCLIRFKMLDLYDNEGGSS